MASGALTAAWGAEIAVITARDLVDQRRPPLPSELLSSFAVFGVLALLAIPAPRAAAAAGWGLVLATFLSSQIDFFGPVGDFMSGRFGTFAGPSEAGGAVGAGGQIATGGN